MEYNHKRLESDEYEDDFETLDDIDESPRTKQRKGRSTSHGFEDENISSSLDLDISSCPRTTSAEINSVEPFLDNINDSLDAGGG